MPRDPGPARRRLLHVFSTFSVGGPQARTARLIRCIDRSIEHVLVAADGRLEGVEALELAGRVRAIPGAFVKSTGIAPVNLGRIRALLRAERPDLLLTYNFGAIEAALAHRLQPICPHLHFEDGFGPDEPPGHQLARRIWLRRFALSGRTRIVVPSRTLERIAHDRWRFAAARIEYLPNGVDVDRFAPAAGGHAQAGGIRIGSVSALRPEKNVARILHAFAALSPLAARLVIAGDGPERPALTALAGRLGLGTRVEFLGHVARPEALLREVDLFVLGSDTEQMPLGLLEAMASGLPIVATDVGDVRLMLPAEQRPFAVRCQDEAAFAAALATLAADRELRLRLGAANRAQACAHFNERAMIRRYAQLFRAEAAGPADALRRAG